MTAGWGEAIAGPPRAADGCVRGWGFFVWVRLRYVCGAGTLSEAAARVRLPDLVGAEVPGLHLLGAPGGWMGVVFFFANG